MRISVYPQKQKSETDCWLACLQMVMNYFQLTATLREIEEFVIKDKHGGLYLTEQARFAKSRGLKVDCYAYNLYYTHPSYSTLTKKELITKINERKSKLNVDWHTQIETTIKCIEEGVNYIIKKPKTLDVILEPLTRDIPPIISINRKALLDMQIEEFSGHAIVLTGYEKNRIYYIDPAQGTENSKDQSDFFFGFMERRITAASAYMVAVDR